MKENSFFEFKANGIKGNEILMEEYKGKVVLVVNTASKCGLTPQYEGLQKLYSEYSDKGLVILGFPCDQFANQEPGDESEINSFCSINYGVSFPMFSKIDVNGKNAHPLYKYLKKMLPGLIGNKIKWNFTKFLIGPDGIPVKRYAPTVAPENMTEDILNLIKSV